MSDLPVGTPDLELWQRASKHKENAPRRYVGAVVVGASYSWSTEKTSCTYKHLINGRTVVSGTSFRIELGTRTSELSLLIETRPGSLIVLRAAIAMWNISAAEHDDASEGALCHT